MKSTRKRRTTETFIEDCKIIHNNIYTYEKTIYKTLHDKVIITCPKEGHGDFIQLANHHKKGHGCRICAFEANHAGQRSNTEEFIIKAKNIYGDNFDYSKTVYGKNAHENVTVTCKIHGDIKVKPNGYLTQLTGCKRCGQLLTGWSKTNWRNTCKNKIPKLYIIKCFNETECFYKIGITSKYYIRDRFSGKAMPYKWELEELITSKDPDYIFDLERQLHRLNKQFIYRPKIFFEGFTECFSEYSTH